MIADISLEEDENCAFDYLELREDGSRGARYLLLLVQYFISVLEGSAWKVLP